MVSEDLSDASVSQEIPKIVNKSPDSMKIHGTDSLLEPFWGGCGNPDDFRVMASRQKVSVI